LDITGQDYMPESKQPPPRIAVCASLLIRFTMFKNNKTEVYFDPPSI
jgi:hypothetical protein